MTIITRIGIALLVATIVLTTTTATKYSIEIYDSLPYVNLREFLRPKLYYQLVRPRYTAEFKRLMDSGDLHFHVFTGAPQFRPGIRASPKIGKKEQLFLLTEMIFESRPNRCGSLVNFYVRFHNERVTKCIEIQMTMFKRPGDEELKHAIEHHVPVVSSPIPEGYLQHMDTRPRMYETQDFKGDLKWIDPILKRATFAYDEKVNKIMKFVYKAGPIILKEESSFDSIVALDRDIHSCISGEGHSHRETAS